MHGGGNVADFIQEDGSAVGGFKTAEPTTDGATVLKYARLLLASKRARGWSHALDLARTLAAPPTKKARS